MRPIKKNSTDQSVVIRIIDSSDGTPETGVEHDTSGIDLWYRREGATKTSITEAALASLDAAHSDGGIEHIGDGYYRLDLPDAAVATGANGVMVGGTVTGMIVIGCYVPLVDYDPYDSVRAGLTALPNAAADAAGGLPISDAGSLDVDTLLGRITANVATEAKQDTMDTVVDGIQTDLDNATDGLGALKALIDTVDGVADAIKSKTDNLPASPAAVGSQMALANDAITSAKYDESTAFPVKSADTGATQIARVGADGDTLETLSDQIDGVSAGDATAANQTTILSRIGTPANIDGGGADLSNNIKKIADDNAGASFDATNHSLHAIRTRGDAAWITGGGGAITQMLNIQPLIPSTIDLADTATVRIGIGLTNMLDDLPSTAEITPGTISIDRKATGGTAWTSVVSDAACSEAAGIVYYDEVFDSTTGYRPGDSIRVTFKGQKITVDANDHEITPADGWMFQTYIRGAERTDTANAAHTYTVLDGDGNGIADVLVEAKINDVLIQSARTNSSGMATFYLAAGTYDFYATKAGYSFTNPDSETVS